MLLFPKNMVIEYKMSHIKKTSKNNDDTNISTSIEASITRKKCERYIIHKYLIVCLIKNPN